MKALAGLAAGIVIGNAVEISVAGVEAEIFAVVLMAALDSVLGGLCAKLSANFSDAVLIGGFFVSLLFGGILIVLGKVIGVELYLIALLIFGLRIFKNFVSIKNFIAQKYLG